MALSFARDMWDGVELVADRINLGVTVTREMSTYFKKRAAIEDEYAKKLLKLSEVTRTHCAATKQACSGEGWRTYTAFQLLINQTDMLGKQHEMAAQTIRDQVAQPLADLKTQMKRKREVLLADSQSCIRTIEDLKATVDKLKAKYEVAAHMAIEDRVAWERVMKDPNAKPSATIKAKEKWQKSVEATEAPLLEWRAYVEMYNKRNEKHVTEDLPYYLEQFQFLEEDRINTARAALSLFVDTLLRIPEVVIDNLDRLRHLINVSEASAQLQTYISKHKTSRPYPAPLVVEEISLEPATPNKKPAPAALSMPYTERTGPRSARQQSASEIRRRKNTAPNSHGEMLEYRSAATDQKKRTRSASMLSRRRFTRPHSTAGGNADADRIAANMASLPLPDLPPRPMQHPLLSGLQEEADESADESEDAYYDIDESLSFEAFLKQCEANLPFGTVDARGKNAVTQRFVRLHDEFEPVLQ